MTISEILKELNLENGSNYKNNLRKHKGNELWKKVLYYAYIPNFNYYIKKSLTITMVNYCMSNAGVITIGS